MTAKKIDVKNTSDPFNLGRADKWSKEDVSFLLSNGAKINRVGYVHIPLDKLEGEVLLGIGQKQTLGEEPPKLFVNGRKINTGRKPFLCAEGHKGEI